MSAATHALRSSDRPHDRRRSTLAREKNTSRAEARRRSREQVRAQIAAEEADEVEEAAPDQPEPERRPLFKMPNVREDVRALPSIFRSRRLLWLPLALLAVGMILTLVSPSLSPEVLNMAALFVQFFFVPPALFTFFVAGFLAPRASYLVGLLYGLLAGVFWFVAFVPASAVPDGSSFAQALGGFLFTGALYGTLAAAFAAWYRDFLRGMQERGKQRRAAREVDERTRRREQRQEARKIAKQRPTT